MQGNTRSFLLWKALEIFCRREERVRIVKIKVYMFFVSKKEGIRRKSGEGENLSVNIVTIDSKGNMSYATLHSNSYNYGPVRCWVLLFIVNKHISIVVTELL